MTTNDLPPDIDIERHVRFYLDRDQPVLFLYDDEHPEGVPVDEFHPAVIGWAMWVVHQAESGEYPEHAAKLAEQLHRKTREHQRRLDAAAEIRRRLDGIRGGPTQ